MIVTVSPSATSATNVLTVDRNAVTDVIVTINNLHFPVMIVPHLMILPLNILTIVVDKKKKGHLQADVSSLGVTSNYDSNIYTNNGKVNLINVYTIW